MTFKIADLWATLMTDQLGYDRYGAHGGDWGSMVTEHLARSYADSLVGVHLTDVPFAHLFQKPDDLSLRERQFVKAAEKWQQKEGAYAMIQGSVPFSLAPGLNYLPRRFGRMDRREVLLVERLRWRCGKAIYQGRAANEYTLYWATETIYSSFLPYYDATNASALTWIVEMVRRWTGSSQVPMAFASFPRDLLPPPREWAERYFNVQRWTEMPPGRAFCGDGRTRAAGRRHSGFLPSAQSGDAINSAGWDDIAHVRTQQTRLQA